MNPRLLKISAILSSLLLAAGFIYYRTANSTLADEPNGSQPSTKPRTLLPSSKSFSGSAVISPGSLNATSQPATTQPPATGMSPEAKEALRRDLIMSSSKSSGIVSPEDLARRQAAQQKAQQQAQQQDAQQEAQKTLQQRSAPATMPESIP